MPYDAGQNALDIPQVFTFWDDVYGRDSQETRISLRNLALIFSETSQIDNKRYLPLLSGGLFGNKADPKSGSKRTLANLRLNSAVLLDYDDGDPNWIEMAKENCRQNGVAALFYSSASWTPEHQTWRVIFPVVELREIEDYQRLVARADGGIIAGTADPASYDGSRGYFYRGLKDRPQPIVVMVEGGPIDFADHLAHVEEETLRIKRNTRRTEGLPPADLEVDRSYVMLSELQTELLARMTKRLTVAPDKQKHFRLWAVARHVGGVARKISDHSEEMLADYLLDQLRQSASSMNDEDAARDTAIKGLRAGAAKPLAVHAVLDAFGLGVPFRNANIDTKEFGPLPFTDSGGDEWTKTKRPDPWAFGNGKAQRDIPPTPWIAKPLLLQNTVTAIIAAGGVGKSLFILQVAVLLALGRDIWIFGNVHRGTPKRSVIYNAEDDIDQMSRRLHAACTELQVDPSLVFPYITLVSGEDVDLRLVKLENRNAVRNYEIASKLVTAARHPDCVMIALDPMIQLHELNENDNRDMTFVMDFLKKIAKDARVAMLLAHHTSKLPMAATQGYVGNTDTGRGASAIVYASRAAFTLHFPTEKDVSEMALTDEEQRRLVRLDNGKSNYALLGGPTFWLEKKTVTLWDGEEVGTLVAADIKDRTESERQRIGTVLANDMHATNRASMTITEAIAALRRNDTLWNKMKDSAARERLGVRTARPIGLDDSRVVEMVAQGGSKVLALR